MRLDFFGNILRLPTPVLCAAVLLSTVLLSACAFTKTEETPVGMSVSVTLRDVHRCSRISPEIQITEEPQGTDYYAVHLVESAGGPQELLLGGGSWDNDGSGIIPEGGLTRHYRGPCPPAGQTREYTFMVSAMSRKNEQPLAVRLYRFTQE